LNGIVKSHFVYHLKEFLNLTCSLIIDVFWLIYRNSLQFHAFNMMDLKESCC